MYIMLHITFTLLNIAIIQSYVHKRKAAPWKWFSIVLFINYKALAAAATLPVMLPTSGLDNIQSVNHEDIAQLHNIDCTKGKRSELSILI